MTLGLVPFALDQTTSVALAEVALKARLSPGENLQDLLPPLESSIRSARAIGGLVRSDGETWGIVVWEPSGPLGVAVRILYLTAEHAGASAYRGVLDLIEQSAGPIAFAPSPLAGLSASEESVLMRGRGFGLYGRSEMSLPPSATVPVVPVARGAELRPVRETDEPLLARLHEVAYRDHLDRFLSLEDLDPVRDADRQLRKYFAAEYGEILTPGSSVVTFEGKLVAAAMAVQRPGQALVIDVMSDPSVRGRGFARAALADALRGLRGRGVSRIVLNVTEGNDRAIRLYSGLGFVRSIGPSSEWYFARRMPVRFPSDYSGEAAAGASGSGAR